MFIIAIHDKNPFTNEPELSYLGWQHPAWDEDGYFLTSKENIQKVIQAGNNTYKHPFLFKTEYEARNKARELKIRGFIIRKWE